MSHASLLVALDPTDDVEAAVAEQMAPFDENGSWFADGSRWDWYQIGGRCDGLLANGNVLQRKALDLAKCASFPAHHAFLRNRNWHEHERMGWFGGQAATECERAGAETHICTHEKDGARIISWGGSDSWDKMFYPRFVEPLSLETLLVTVDYHV